MSKRKQLIATLMDRHGTSFSKELGIELSKGTPSVLFRWLCASLLFSARIGNQIAIEAAKSLTKSGWTTAKKMAEATWGRTHASV